VQTCEWLQVRACDVQWIDELLECRWIGVSRACLFVGWIRRLGSCYTQSWSVAPTCTTVHATRQSGSSIKQVYWQLEGLFINSHRANIGSYSGSIPPIKIVETQR